MKLEFNSIGELAKFLEWSRTLGAIATVTAGELFVSDPADLVLRDVASDLSQALTAGNELAFAEEPCTASATTGSTDNVSDNVEVAEPTKRKRRTKAEMEAARASEAAPQNISAEIPAASANPFEANAASATTQAILNAPNQGAAILAGMAAMQQSPFESNAPAKVATSAAPVTQPATGDANAFIETRSLEILSTQAEPLTAVKHMHVCREFIAKHGQQKYLQGFALAGLPATVGTYKADQCARHQAALEFLNAN